MQVPVALAHSQTGPAAVQSDVEVRSSQRVRHSDPSHTQRASALQVGRFSHCDSQRATQVLALLLKMHVVSALHEAALAP
jgi:hypothetical protein